MKTYTIEVVVTEGNDEFWEEATANGATGCEDVLRLIKEELDMIGFSDNVKLVKFEDK